METLLEALTEFGADADLIAQVEAFAASQTEPAEGTDPPEPLGHDDLTSLRSELETLAGSDEAGDDLVIVIADAHELISNEIDTLETEAAEREAARQAALEAIRNRGKTGADQTDDPENGLDDPEAVENPQDPEDPEDAADENENELAGVPAAGPNRAARREFRRAANRYRPADAAPVETPNQGPEIVFSVDVPNVTPGTKANNLGDVDRAMHERARLFTTGGGRAGRGSEHFYPVATIRRDVPQERSLLDDNGRMLAPHVAAGRVKAAIDEAIRGYRTSGLPAAGGLCNPLQPIYTVDTLGEQSRPIRDTATASFQATRGGVISVAPPSLPMVAAQDPNAVGVWTMSNDEDATGTEGPRKSVARIECGAPRQTEIQAITMQLLVGNVINRTFSEYVDAWSETVLVHHDREAELELWRQIQNSSITVNHSAETTSVSATRDLLNLLNRVSWNLRSRYRMLRSFPFRVVLPEVVYDLVQADLANSLPGGGSTQENLNVADGMIQQFFTARNLNVTWSPDLVVADAIAAGSPVPDWPGSVPYALYPEGTFLHLDAGTLDLGVVRDSQLNKANDFESFAESFEAIHPLGHIAVAGTVEVCPSGAVVGTVDPAAICGGS